MSGAVIEAIELMKRYGKARGIAEMDLAVPHGGIFGFPEASGMDRLSVGEPRGFFVIEAGIVLGIGGVLHGLPRHTYAGQRGGGARGRISPHAFGEAVLGGGAEACGSRRLHRHPRCRLCSMPDRLVLDGRCGHRLRALLAALRRSARCAARDSLRALRSPAAHRAVCPTADYGR